MIYNVLHSCFYAFFRTGYVITNVLFLCIVLPGPQIDCMGNQEFLILFHDTSHLAQPVLCNVWMYSRTWMPH